MTNDPMGRKRALFFFPDIIYMTWLGRYAEYDTADKIKSSRTSLLLFYSVSTSKSVANAEII